MVGAWLGERSPSYRLRQGGDGDGLVAGGAGAAGGCGSASDRGAATADRPYFSGKHRVHGMNVPIIATPDGTILWTSGALPGRTHDLTAARIWGILRALEKAGIITLADKAYQGAEGPVVTPYKGKNKPQSQKQANRSHARLRGPGERANAQLKSWRILRKLRSSPSKAGHLCKAIAVLQNHRAAQAARG
ncbi:transposase family protein [Streptosporangium sp. NPDC052375]|uniref:transposase family protein n=1 Tax=Streptosporangium sp. NPDC052375 TaxID=3366195 RepID=UPI0037D5B321